MKKKVNHATLNEKKKKYINVKRVTFRYLIFFVACERVYLVTIIHIELSP